MPDWLRHLPFLFCHILLHLLSRSRLPQKCQQPNISLNLSLQLLILCSDPFCSENLIHLLQRPALRFGNKKGHIQDGEGREAPEEYERPVVGGFDEWGREETNGEVVQLLNLIVSSLVVGASVRQS